MTTRWSRRSFTSLLVTATAGLTARSALAADEKPRWQKGRSPWPLCLDTATIRPQTLENKIRFAAAHGFDAIEPWEGELNQFEKNGGRLEDLGQRIRDAGLFVPSVIGLWKCLQTDEAAFEANLDATRNRLRQAQAIGAQHVQVIPWFDWPKVTPAGTLDRAVLARHYRRILDMGLNEYNLQPAFVFLEFVHDLRTVSHAREVLALAGHTKAQMIPDTFHMYVGGSTPADLADVPGSSIGIFQFADAPGHIPRESLKDEHRVLPGDGILPLADSLRHLRRNRYEGAISLELYNPSYHARDPDELLPEAREKTLAVIEASAKPA